MILKYFLIFSGIFQIIFWGLSHIFFPEWFLTSVANKDLSLLNVHTVFWVNEIGIFVIGIGIVTILAAFNPIKHYAIIILLFIVGFGCVGATLFQILVRHASDEWSQVAIIIGQLSILAILYPWTALKLSIGRE